MRLLIAVFATAFLAIPAAGFARTSAGPPVTFVKQDTAALAVAFVLAVAAAGSVQPSLGSLPAGSGIVMGFAFDARASGSVYAAMLGGRVYKSADGGRHWRSTTTAPLSSRVDALVADSRRPGTLYAGTGTAVFRTVNGGGSWKGFNRGLLPPPPVIEPGHVIGTPGHRESEGWVSALAVDPADSDIVYAGTGGGVKKSTDGGRSWRTVFWRGRYMGVSALVIAPTTPRVVYAAAGISWPAACGSGGTTPCGYGTMLYKSADGGKTWRPTSLRRDPDPNGYATLLAVDPRHPTTLYAATGRTVQKSTDAGSSWQSITDGLPGNNIGTLAVDPRGAGTVYVGLWQGGIYKTTNGGGTWSQALSGSSVSALAIDPAHPATIYAGVGSNREPRILRSTNSGRTWATVG